VFDLAIFPYKLRREGDNPVTRRLRPVADEDEKSFLKTTTGAPAFFTVDPTLVVLLRLWHERCWRPAGDEAIVRGVECERRREAVSLRADLSAAGVKRAALDSKDPNVELLRFHDLRATFVTWTRRAQMPDAWISERTGHQSEEMIARYTRA